jgi:hypothetical protein
MFKFSMINSKTDRSDKYTPFGLKHQCYGPKKGNPPLARPERDSWTGC